MDKSKTIVEGISLVESGYMGNDIAAIYILRQGNEVAIIETGTKHSIQNIQSALEQDGLSFADVSYIIPTHVHLDHAAGAGELMTLCKNAQLVIHPKGARHMVDPSKLIAGTMTVYGQDKFNQLYGDLVPIDATRIIEADDKFVLDFSGRELVFIDTPGHANHHFCIWDSLTKSMFTGDTFGLSYREFDVDDQIYIFPTTTPVQFNPEELIKSIDKLMQYQPQRMYLTHFSEIKPTQKIVAQLKEGINFMSHLAKQYATQDNAEEIIQNEMMAYLLKKLQEMGHDNQNFCKDKLKNDVNLNTQGLIYWQQRLASKQP